jgi:ectoine hydroxylase-related dioxygenase (phytanoyl-CoA dioxygenase family)
VNTTVSRDDIDCYQENGFFIKEDFLSQDEVEHWIKTLDVALEGRGAKLLPEMDDMNLEWEPNEDSEYYSRVFVQRVNLWQDSDAVKALILDSAIGKMCTELAHVDGLRVWHDQALYKAPWANATAWHPDDPFWSFYSPDAVSIWIALDDATKENGCMYFLPGTHKKGDFTKVNIGVNMDTVFETHPEFKKVSPVCAAMKAGSCSIHNGLVIHGAGANMTPNWRRAMTCAYMPVGSTYNGQQNVLTKTQMAKLQVGDVMEDDEQNPIIWQRSMKSAAS